MDATDQRQAPSTDLSTPTQVHHLVTAFYREITFDPLLAPLFDEVAEVDWSTHIPRLIDYWCWILFRRGTNDGDVVSVHRHLHAQRRLEPAHCDRWFDLWSTCIGERWAGPLADRAEQHAATLMAGLAKHVFGFTWTAPGRHPELAVIGTRPTPSPSEQHEAP